MKKKVVLMLTATILIAVTGCGKATEDAVVKDVVEGSAESSQESAVQESGVQESIAPKETETPGFTFTQIKESPDKYTWYVKDYVGKNCATLGEEYSGMLYDEYGAGGLRLVFVTADGSHVDAESQEALKEYVVTRQSLEPNTEIKLTFGKDKDGNEVDYRVIHQTQREIILTVKRVGTDEEYEGAVTVINSSPDKYTYYISDYVGRNLADCGYNGYGDYICDEYGGGTIVFVVVTEDGTFIDPEDDEQLRGYKVVAQSVAPNTEFILTYQTNNEGVEYDSYVKTQNFYEIDLYVSPIPGYVPSEPEATEEPVAPEETVVVESVMEPAETVVVESTEVSEEPESAEPEVGLVDGMRPEFKAAMDSYEEFYAEYCGFMEKYNQNPSDLTLTVEYYQLLIKMEEMEADFAAWTEGELNDAEFVYYLEMSDRVMERMLEVAG